MGPSTLSFIQELGNRIATIKEDKRAISFPIQRIVLVVVRGKAFAIRQLISNALHVAASLPRIALPPAFQLSLHLAGRVSELMMQALYFNVENVSLRNEQRTSSQVALSEGACENEPRIMSQVFEISLSRAQGRSGSLIGQKLSPTISNNSTSGEHSPTDVEEAKGAQTKDPSNPIPTNPGDSSPNSVGETPESLNHVVGPVQNGNKRRPCSSSSLCESTSAKKRRSSLTISLEGCRDQIDQDIKSQSYNIIEGCLDQSDVVGLDQTQSASVSINYSSRSSDSRDLDLTDRFDSDRRSRSVSPSTMIPKASFKSFGSPRQCSLSPGKDESLNGPIKDSSAKKEPSPDNNNTTTSHDSSNNINKTNPNRNRWRLTSTDKLNTLIDECERMVGGRKLYVCKFCAKVYEIKSSMRYHMKIIHLQMHLRTTEMQCRICGKQFTCVSAVNRHQAKCILANCANGEDSTRLLTNGERGDGRTRPSLTSSSRKDNALLRSNYQHTDISGPFLSSSPTKRPRELAADRFWHQNSMDANASSHNFPARTVAFSHRNQSTTDSGIGSFNSFWLDQSPLQPPLWSSSSSPSSGLLCPPPPPPPQFPSIDSYGIGSSSQFEQCFKAMLAFNHQTPIQGQRHNQLVESYNTRHSNDFQKTQHQVVNDDSFEAIDLSASKRAIIDSATGQALLPSSI